MFSALFGWGTKSTKKYKFLGSIKLDQFFVYNPYRCPRTAFQRKKGVFG
jgi:hypothetical protein